MKGRLVATYRIYYQASRIHSPFHLALSLHVLETCTLADKESVNRKFEELLEKSFDADIFLIVKFKHLIGACR